MGRIIALLQEGGRAALGGWGGVASLSCSVMPAWGAERARHRADVAAAISTLAASASARCSGSSRSGAGRNHPRPRSLRHQPTPSNTTKLPTITVSGQRPPPKPMLPREARGRHTNARAAVITIPDRRSQRGGRNADRAANGEPDGHFRRRPQLSPGGRDPPKSSKRRPALPSCSIRATGKANQYYLRGYNLDHGTDMATFWDDVPINLPTNAHGQGYTDLNFLIPETVSGLEVRKGPYLGGRRRLRQCGRIEYLAAGQRRPQHPVGHRRQLRL